jgi:hypothetical protein
VVVPESLCLCLIRKSPGALIEREALRSLPVDPFPCSSEDDFRDLCLDADLSLRTSQQSQDERPYSNGQDIIPVMTPEIC